MQEVTLTNIDVINGQQTIRSIWNHRKDLSEDAQQKYILLHAFLNDDDRKARWISSASNTQSLVSTFEIISTFPFNQNLQKELLEKGIFYSYRTGKTNYSKQFSFLPQVTLKEILKYASIKLDGNVWVKNKLDPIMKEVVFKLSKNKVSELVKTNDDEEINRNFEAIASTIAQANQLRKKLKYSQSFDIFASLFMKNEAKARAFLETFNKRVEELVKTMEEEGTIPGNNPANIFKSKKHSGAFYDKIKEEFEKLGG